MVATLASDAARASIPSCLASVSSPRRAARARPRGRVRPAAAAADARVVAPSASSSALRADDPPHHVAPPPPASSLLPRDHDARLVASSRPNRVADVSRYWAMPNLRPLRESSDAALNVAKLASFFILAAVLGAVVHHNVQEDRARREGGRVVDVDVDDHLGYGFAYGEAYGRAYGYAYGHAYGDDAFTNARRAPAAARARREEAEREPRERWSESANPAKRAAGKIGIGLKGLWEAIPA